MKFKKIIASVSLLLAVSMFIGCGKGAGTAEDVDTAQNTPQEKAQLADAVVTTYEATDMSDNPSQVTDRKDTLVIATDAFSEQFNPLFANSVYDQRVMDVMYRTFNGVDDEGEMTQTDLAELPQVSDDNLTYTYKIKDNANWSDGTPITTKDAELSIKIICDESYDGEYDLATGTTQIAGAKEYREGADSISGIKIIDDKTMEITLEQVSSSAVYDLGGILPIEYDYYSKYYTQGNLGEMKETFLSPGPASGPYKFVRYKTGEEFDLEANDKFYAGAPNIKNVVFKVTPAETRLSILQSGGADIGMQIKCDEDNIEEIQDVGFLGYVMYPDNGYGYIGFNLDKPVLQDKAVRQALAYGLDREKITESVDGKYAKVINIPQTEASWTYSEVKNDYAFDLEKAKQILDDAGWVVGTDGIREKDGQKLAIHYTGTTGSKTTAAIIAVGTENYKELGVDFTSEIIDFPTVIEKLESGDIETYCIGWSLSADPNSKSLFSSDGTYNYGHFTNEKLDEIYDKIQVELDQEKQKELYAELYDILNEELPYIYMSQSYDMTAYNGRVKNLKESPYVPFTMNIQDITLE